tara:strand:+ start:2296 stop:3366 length:1071 start_codon:yes stop_codon:yes gene_type:complete
MQVVLFGTGQMGQAIAYLLKQKIQVKHISTFDINDASTDLCTDEHHICNLEEILSKDPFLKFTPDIVISSLPYYLNVKLANFCISRKLPYFDLGGSVQTSTAINRSALLHESVVFTDLGLAPGWANIMAEAAWQMFDDINLIPHSIKMRCGGLPRPDHLHDDDAFNYSLTWSEEGLYNEYVSPSEVLVDGEIKTLPSLTNLEHVKLHSCKYKSDGLELEAFLTSGGTAHTLPLMKNRGVRNCSYKTLRYPGHLNLIKYFIEVKKYRPHEISSLFVDYPKGDMVIVDVEASSDDVNYHKAYTITPTARFSAMQRATAGGLIAAALSRKAIQQDRPLNYNDVDTKMFVEFLKIMDIIP